MKKQKTEQQTSNSSSAIVDEQKQKKIQTALDKIAKQFGKDALVSMSEENLEKMRAQIEVIPTGSLSLDIALGVGGLPKGRIIEVAGPESGGKCKTLNSWVLTAHNGYQTMKDIFESQGINPSCVTKQVECQYPLINYKGQVENTTHFTLNGKRDVYSITTYSGFVHETTSNHPLLVLQDGVLCWKEAKNICRDDVLVQINSQVFGNKQVNEKTTYAIGLLLADGTLTDTIMVTNSDPDIVNFIENDLCSAIEANEVKVNQRRQNNVVDYRINVGDKKQWYDKWQLKKAVAKDKVIPNWIFSCEKQSLASFVRGFVDVESHISEGSISICSASYQLLYQLKLILSQFNINSHLFEQSWETKGYEDNRYWRLEMYGDDVYTYYDEIGTQSNIKRKQFSVFFENRTHCNDTIPNIEPLFLSFCKTLTGTRELQKIKTDVVSKHINVTYNKLRKLIQYAEKSNEINDLNIHIYNQLKSLLNYKYDKVKAATKLSEPQPTFDFAMQYTHTFIADGCINHNTTLTLHVIAEAQKRGGVCAFIDAEHAFDPDYAKRIGVNMDTLYFNQPYNGEQGLEIATAVIESGGFDVVVIDSVAALTPKSEIDGEIGDSKMGVQARMMSQAMRKMVSGISNSKCVVIFINQLRQKIGNMYGPSEVTTGGDALKYYSTIRLDVRRGEKLGDKDNVTGNGTRVKVIKNKVAPPFKTANFDIIFGQGISKIGEIIDLGTDLDIIKKSGSWYSYDGTQLAQGKENTRELLMDNIELAEEIEQKIREAVGL